MECTRCDSIDSQVSSHGTRSKTSFCTLARGTRRSDGILSFPADRRATCQRRVRIKFRQVTPTLPIACCPRQRKASTGSHCSCEVDVLRSFGLSLRLHDCTCTYLVCCQGSHIWSSLRPPAIFCLQSSTRIDDQYCSTMVLNCVHLRNTSWIILSRIVCSIQKGPCTEAFAG